MNNISLVCVLIFILFAGLYALINYRYLDKGLRFVAILCVYSVFTECLAVPMAKSGIPNTWVYALFWIAEFILLTCFYYTILQAPIYKKIVLVCGTCVGIYMGYWIVRLGITAYTLTETTALVSNTFFWALTILSTVELLRQSNILQSQMLNPNFWVNVGLFIYFGFNTLGIVNYTNINLYAKDFISFLAISNHLFWAIRLGFVVYAFYLSKQLFLKKETEFA